MTQEITAQTYADEIESIAQNALEEANGDREAARESIWETVDSHQWVIYTAYNTDVLKYSANEDAGIEQGLVDANHALKEGGLGSLLAQLACCAMMQDAYEALDKLPDPEEDDEAWTVSK